MKVLKGFTVFENHPKCRNFSIWAFSTNLCPIKSDLSGNIVWLQFSGFPNLAKIDHFGTFNELLSTQNDSSLRSQCWMRLFLWFFKHRAFIIADSTSRIELMSPKLSDVYHYLLPFLYGLTHVSKVGSVFTTLAVSLERYFAVCRPLWIRIRRCHPALYIVLVTVFAFAFNIPKFLEFEVRNVSNVPVIHWHFCKVKFLS